MRPRSTYDRPLRVTVIDEEVVFLGEGPVAFSMTATAAKSTLHNLAEALLAARPAPMGRAKGVVLLVEDEISVREVAAAILEEAGYLVICTDGPKAALLALEGADEIHLLFTDVQMPGGVDGLELARLVRDRWPTIHLLVTSGKSGSSLEGLPAGGRFLAKPYAAADILRHIEEMMAA